MGNSLTKNTSVENVKLKIFSAHRSLFLESVVVIFLASIFSLWLSQRALKPEFNGFYIKTGDYSTIEGYSTALNVELFSQSVIFVLFTILVYFLLRWFSSRLLSFLFTALFVSNAQVVLVFISAPFWDFSTALIPILSLTITGVVLQTRSSRLKFCENCHVALAVGLSLFSFLITCLYFRVVNLLEIRFVGLYTFLFILILISAILWRNGSIYYSTSINSEHQQIYFQLYFVPIFFILFSLEPILGRARSFAGVVLIISLIYFLIRETRIKKILKILIVAVYLLLMSQRNNGSLSTRGFAEFYLFAGWMDAPKLLAGHYDSSKSFGAYFSDSTILEVTSANTVGGTSQLFSNLLIQLSTIIWYARIGFSFLFRSFWDFGEPPAGFEDSRFFIFRTQIVSMGSYVASFLSFAGFILFFRKFRELFSLMVTTAIGVVILISVSRTQMHQWWSIQLFGLCGVVFALNQLTNACVKFWYSELSRSVSPRVINLSRQFLLFFRMKNRMIIQFLLVFLLTFLVPTATFDSLSKFAERIERKQILNLTNIYSNQDWRLISTETFTRFRIKPTFDILKIEVNDGCNLSGLRVVVRSLISSSDLNPSSATKNVGVFNIGRTSLTVAYIPLFANSKREVLVSAEYSYLTCQLHVYQAKLNDSDLPLIGLIASRSQNGTPIRILEKTPSPKYQQYSLLSNFKFEGYSNEMQFNLDEGDLASRWNTTEIAKRIIGQSDEGYTSVDLYSHELNEIGNNLRIRVTGNLTRGVVAIGWAQLSTEASQNSISDFDYQVLGSAFDATRREINSCFEIGDVSRIGSDHRYVFYISSIIDFYSPRWTSINVSSIIVDNGQCGESRNEKGFLPKL